MRTAKITTESGHSWTTDINGTDQSICEYFLGNQFDVGIYPAEKMEAVVSVEIDDSGEVFTISDLGCFCPECGKLLHYYKTDSEAQYFDVDRNRLCAGGKYKHAECC